RISTNFDLLYDHPETIAKLRAAILQLAVQGKLVPQDPNDEPASALLERIRAEKERLVKGKKIRRSKPLIALDESDIHYYAPPGWIWLRLGELIHISSGDFLPSTKMAKNGSIPVYGGNGITGYHDQSNVTEPTLVIGRVGFYCGSIHLTPDQAWVTDNAFITDFPEEQVSRAFLYWLLRGTDLRQDDSATAQPVISGRKINPLHICLPPLEEQHRIVAKVDQLMELCDELETKLNQAQKRSERLMEATVQQLLVA
ncbi:MAG: restriction endonuclease subunit S, partial [Anaerolineales bacterium]